MILKFLRLTFTVALSTAALFAISSSAALAKPASSTASNLWVTGYYPGWQDDLKPQDIDYAGLTHVIYFTIFPNADGSLDFQNGVNDATADALAADAHKAGKKVLICIGGDGAAKAYRKAIKQPVRGLFVQNVVNWVALHDFDGVDIDFEPMKAADVDDFKGFVKDLRGALDLMADLRYHGTGRKMLMTAAVECQGFSEMFGELQADFDQINLMTYDMAGGWSAETWYNSPLMNGNGVKGLDGDVLPSTDQFIDRWRKNVAPSKLGIGVCCEGRVWHGSDKLAQDRGGQPVETAPYSAIMDKYFNPDQYHWDDGAKASSLVVPGDASSKALVVYDDIHDARAKVDYAKRNKLGGIILWELSEEYRPSLTLDKRHPLSSAAHAEAMATVLPRSK